MDLRQLEIIRAIAATGSFTAAGAQLGVSQSAISRQILLLEESLSEAVFLRIGRRVRITPVGEALLQLSHRVLQDVKDTVALITDSQASLLGSVRLVGGMTVSLYVFPPLLKHFRRDHPQVDIRITAGSSETCTSMIRTGAADLGLITLPLDEPDLVTVPAIEEEMLLVTAPQHPLAQKPRIVASDIRGEQFVLFEPGSATRRVIDEFFIRDAIAPRIVIETENVEILKALVRKNIGVAILPYLAVAREAVSGHFFTSRIHGRTLVRKTGWVYARASRVPRTVQEILRAFDHIKGRLKLAPPTHIERHEA